MTLDSIRKMHRPGKAIRFTHPELNGTMGFSPNGRLQAFNAAGADTRIVLSITDFQRSDWELVAAPAKVDA